MALTDRSIFESITPEWVHKKPRLAFGKFLYLIAAGFDALMEGVYQARSAAMPGQVQLPGVPGMGGFDTVDSLPFVGRDRMIRRGLSERPEAYAARLRQWLGSWVQAGTPWMLLQQLAGLLGPDAGILRIVTAGGVWWTWDGTTVTMQTHVGTGFAFTPSTGALSVDTSTAHFWNWDSLSKPQPFDQNDNSRFWVICYAPLNAPYETGNDKTFADAGLVNDFWNNLTSSYAHTPLTGTVASPDAGTIGLSAPQSWVENVRHVIGDWKSAGLSCAYLIVSFDPAAFNPITDSTPTSVPDGRWAWHCAYNSLTMVREIARFPNAEYVVAPSGGQRP